MDINTNILIQNLVKEFSDTKELCSKLYKKLENSKTKPQCDELIILYKQIINNLKDIKEKSRALDNVEIEEDYIGTEEEINQLRENNYKNLLCLAQQIRGCLQSYNKFKEMMDDKREETQI